MQSVRCETASYPLSLERLAIYYTLPSPNLIREAKPGKWQTGLFSVVESYYDPISPRIYLGSLPVYQLPPDVTMVVSISTYEELIRFNVPENIRHLFLHIPDHTSQVDNSDALDTVLQMRDYLKAHPDNNILIHCKQGHSRSMMMLAILLTIAPEDHDLPSDLTLKEACEFIRKKRPWAHVEDDKFAKASTVIEMFRHSKDHLTATQNHFTDRDTYLASVEFKDALRRKREFIAFVKFATRMQRGSPQGAMAVQNFLYEILHATDGAWFAKFVAGNHPLFELAASGSLLETHLLNLSVVVSGLFEATEAACESSAQLPRVSARK